MKPQEKFGLIEFSLKYPFTNDESKYGGIISCVAGLFSSFIFVPLILIAGYLAKIRIAVINDEENAPKFEDYGELYKMGKGSIISQFPPYFIAIVGLISSAVINPPVLLGFVYLGFLMNPAVKLRYAVEEEFETVYDLDTISMIIDERYLKYHLFYTFLVSVLISLGISLGMFTLGVGFVAVISVLTVIRPAYWGYVYRNELSDIF